MCNIQVKGNGKRGYYNVGHFARHNDLIDDHISRACTGSNMLTPS